MVLDSDTMKFFFEEVLEMLPQWEESCLELEKNIDKPCFDELFRQAHNIKGSAKMVELDDFGDFVHKIEDVINLLRDNKFVLTLDFVELFLDAHSVIVDWVEGLSRDLSYKPEIGPVLKKISMLIKDDGGVVQESNKNVSNVTEKEREPLDESMLEAIVKDNSMETSEDVVNVHITEPLVISHLGEIIIDNKFEINRKYIVYLENPKIDTAGVQYLASLKNSPEFDISFYCSHKELIDVLQELGAEGYLL